MRSRLETPSHHRARACKWIRNPLSGRAAFTRAANCGNGVGSLVRFSREIIVVSLASVRNIKFRGINQFLEYCNMYAAYCACVGGARVFSESARQIVGRVSDVEAGSRSINRKIIHVEVSFRRNHANCTEQTYYSARARKIKVRARNTERMDFKIRFHCRAVLL